MEIRTWEILSEDQVQMKLNTEVGTLVLQKKNITNIEPIAPSEFIIRNDWFRNPQATRYLWSPNGYGLRKGEGYYQNVWVLFNQLSVGVTDHFSLGLGVVPLFLLAGQSTPAWLNAKVSIPLQQDKVNLGVGGLFGTVIGESNSSFGITYGLLTFGSRDRNGTFGIGYGYTSYGWANQPSLSFSAMIRTGPRGYFLTENYYIGVPENGLLLLSVGGRRIISRVGLDYGAVIPVYDGLSSVLFIPWLGITVPLSSK